MRALSPPPVHGGGTRMIIATLIALVVIAVLLMAWVWRSGETKVIKPERPSAGSSDGGAHAPLSREV